MTYDQIGRLLLVLGGVMVLTGLIFVVLGRSNVFGKLPGDFTFSNGALTCLVPVASMIIISIILTLVLNIVLRIFR